MLFVRLGRILIGFLLVVTVLRVWNVQADSSTRQTAAGRFGIVEAYYRPDDARDLGVGWERIIFDWSSFQPDSARQFITDSVPEDGLIAARDAGREVVGLIKNTPHWASGTALLGSPPLGLDLGLDAPGNYWAAFVTRLVAFYSREWHIHHWIILNEPDLRPGEIGWYEFDGGVEDYYRVLKVACLAARQADPTAVIHLAGMAWWTDKAAQREPYLRRLLDVISRDPDAAANGYYFDVVMVHVYFKSLNVWRVISEIEGILTHYGLQAKPVWVAEANARPTAEPGFAGPPLPYDVTLDEQAAFIVHAAALSLAAGVERFSVYRLYDDHYQPGKTEPWGLVRPDGSHRPAFDSYRTVIEQFAGAQAAQWTYSDHSSLVTLDRPGSTVYVMWARRTDGVRFHVLAGSAEERAQRVALDGTESVVEAGAVPGVEGRWFSLDAPGAQLDPTGDILVEGVPVILDLDGPPRAVWIEVEGRYWTLR